MAKRDFQKLSLRLRIEAKHKAQQQAVLVPWRRLAESAETYVGWHIFGLWVRAIVECADELPEIVRSALDARCPGFLEREGRQREERLREQPLVWQSLEEWVSSHHFGDAKEKGWFDAVMYYAYANLRTEQAWSLWERTKEAWHSSRPARWPTLEEWTAHVIGTPSLTQTGSEKARAVEALARVDPKRLQQAVSGSLESRAFALWLACVSQPDQALGELAMRELHDHCPSFLAASGPELLWGRSLFSRLVGFGEAEWRAAARVERWEAALRYQVAHHPRLHRLVHYVHRCQDEWLHASPHPYPSFADWLRGADEYFVLPVA